MSASETIKIILDYLGMTPTEFGVCIGLERSQAIFDMRDGRTKTVSKRMAEKIKKAYPAFSETWLLTGEGKMLEHEMPANCFTDKTPQVISKTNMTDSLKIIQDLIHQLADKDKQLQQLTQDYNTLANAFDVLAKSVGVEAVEPSKKEAI